MRFHHYCTGFAMAAALALLPSNLARAQTAGPGISITPASSATTEAGGKATFSVVLNASPAAGTSVRVPLDSSDPTEGTLSSTLLTFTTSNWNKPQVVTVTGVNDAIDDGDMPYTIITSPATSTDPAYRGMNASDVGLTNLDDDAVGIAVSTVSGNTTEAGAGRATFAVKLNSQPSRNVNVSLNSSDLTEGFVTPGVLVFTPSNWATPQLVTVTGVDDPDSDGDIQYSVVLAPAISGDSTYHGIDPQDVTLMNEDNDKVNFILSSTGPLTVREGSTTTASFTVVASSQPSQDVTIGISSSNPNEGTASPSILTFTSSNWNTPQRVTVKSVNDFVDDGDVAFLIETGKTVSGDTRFNNLDVDDVSVVNVDDDVTGVAFSTKSIVTTELGGTASFAVKLTSQPTDTVKIGLSSTDTAEGTITVNALEFTPANWNTAQNVVVTGVDDPYTDGNTEFKIETAPAVTNDRTYANFNAEDVLVANRDNEGIRFAVTASQVNEAAASARVTVALTGPPKPNKNVRVTFATRDGSAIAPVDYSSLTGDIGWSSSTSTLTRTLVVPMVNDTVGEGNETFQVVLSNPVNGLILSNGVTTVTIPQNDILSFRYAATSVQEDVGVAQLQVNLNGASTEAVDVFYSTNELKAKALPQAAVTSRLGLAKSQSPQARRSATFRSRSSMIRRASQPSASASS
jgi:hypothetical protein